MVRRSEPPRLPEVGVQRAVYVTTSEADARAPAAWAARTSSAAV